MQDFKNNVETIEETTSICSEIDHVLCPEFEISTWLSELNFMLRQLEAGETEPTPKLDRRRGDQSLDSP